MSVIRGASQGILKSSVDEQMLDAIRSELTVTSQSFGNEPPVTYEAFEEDEEFLWVPRCYRLRFEPSQVIDGTALGEPANLVYGGKLLEERDQPAAFEWMSAHLAHNHVGILKAFTDFGKTYVSLALAAHFGRRTAVVTHLGHMLGNWRAKAAELFMLEPGEVGVVGSGQHSVGDVTLFLAQTLTSKSYPASFFDQFGFVIFDEVHHYGSKEWQRIPGMFPARYRLGVSATPERKDGLSHVVNWHCGPVAYKARPRRDDGSQKSVVQIRYQTTYPLRSYCSWVAGKPGPVNPQRYRKKQAADVGRNVMLVREMLKAVKTGRKGLVQSHYREHAEALCVLFKNACRSSGIELPETSLLFGGAKTKAEKQAQLEGAEADWIFATYGFTREALSLPQIDTLIWGTSPGDAEQALGRLRVGGDKRHLLCLDPYEDTEYSIDRAERRASQMSNLGAKVQTVLRRKVVVETPKKKKKKARKPHAQRGKKRRA